MDAMKLKELLMFSIILFVVFSISTGNIMGSLVGSFICVAFAAWGTTHQKKKPII